MTYSVYDIKVDNEIYFKTGLTAGSVLSVNADGSTFFNEDVVSIKEVAATFSQLDWILENTIYKLTYLDSNITSTSRVDIIPNNSTINLVIAAEFLPQTVSANGSVDVFAKNEPTNDISVTLSILK